MNQKIATAFQYAKRIFNEYIELCQLDIKGKKESNDYLEHLLLLKKIIELEKLYYRYIKEEELEAIYRELSASEKVPGWLSSLDIYTVSDEEETFEWDRVMKQITWQIWKKDYPSFQSDIRQVGFIPLYPEENQTYAKYICKTNIYEGCFNTNFSNKVLSGNYPRGTKTYFLYVATYCNQYMENYYLQRKFTWEDKKTAEIILENFAKNPSDYTDCCCAFFKENLIDHLRDILLFHDEEIEEREDLKVWLSILQDGLQSFFEISSYEEAKLRYQYITEMNGNPNTKAQLLKQIRLVMNQKIIQKVYS